MNQFQSFRPIEFDDEYSWEFNSFSSESCRKIVACRFVGYCIDNQPAGEGDIYTPFYDNYYNDRKALFHKRNIHNISLIRKPQKLEERFLIEHIEDEKQGFELSKIFLGFLNEKNSFWFRELYLGYMEYLDERKETLGITEDSVYRGRDWISHRLVDRLKLEDLFVPSFFDKTFSTADMLTRSERLSRFDVLCNRIEMVLSDDKTPVTNKALGSIAYLIYSSEFVKPMYRKPPRTGERGHFSQLLSTFFDIVHKEHPSDKRYNKYEPSQEFIEIFRPVLNSYQSPNRTKNPLSNPL